MDNYDYRFQYSDNNIDTHNDISTQLTPWRKEVNGDNEEWKFNIAWQ